MASLPAPDFGNLSITPFPDTVLPGRLPDGSDEITALHQLMVRSDSPFAAKEFRLSSSDPETCFRRQVYPFLYGHTGKPAPIQVQRIMASGHVFEAWIVSLFAKRFPNVETQRTVPLPHLRASGHIDLYFPDVKHLAELKYVDVSELSDLPKRAHLYQVQSYLHFDREIQSSHLLYGVRGSCELIPFEVKENPEIGAEIEANLVMLNKHVDAGTLPDRINRSPMEFPCTYRKTDFSGTYTVYCGFYEECWQQEATSTVIEGTATAVTQNQPVSAAMVSDLSRLIQIERGMTAANKLLKTVKHERDTLRERIAPLVPPKMPLNFQGHIIQRSVSEPTPRYDIEKAILAGVVTREALAPFQGWGSERERWTIKDAPAPIENKNKKNTTPNQIPF